VPIRTTTILHTGAGDDEVTVSLATDQDTTGAAIEGYLSPSLFVLNTEAGDDHVNAAGDGGVKSTPSPMASSTARASSTATTAMPW
jgi:hypothetical protein